MLLLIVVGQTVKIKRDTFPIHETMTMSMSFLFVRHRHVESTVNLLSILFRTTVLDISTFLSDSFYGTYRKYTILSARTILSASTILFAVIYGISFVLSCI